jgi:excisionase family DNA binding protein
MDNPFSIIDERLANIERSLAKLMFAILDKQQQLLVDRMEEETRLTIAELAEYLNKDKSTILRYKKNSVFPFYQAGRTVYFKKHEVDHALSFGKKKKISG